MTLILRNCSWIYCCDDAGSIIAPGYIRIDGMLISEIGHEPYPGSDGEMIDLAGSIVLPGFVNVHHHFFQSLTKAVPPATRATGLDWLYQMYPIWACYDADAIATASELAAAELLLSGATTSVDHSYLHPQLGAESVAAQVDAVARTGLRFHLVRGALPTIEGDLEVRLNEVMGPALREMMEDRSALMPALAHAIRAYDDASVGSMRRVDLGPTGITYLYPELMPQIAALAAQHGCGLHTHYHPRQSDRELSRRLLGREPLSFLTDCGWIRPRTWMAHSTQLNDEEIVAFADHGVGVAHCPHTIIRLGFPITRVVAMRRRGLAVGIGVDGAASNDRSSMIQEMRLALLLHRANSPENVQAATDWLDAIDILHMATREGARILGRKDIGILKVGMCADIVAFDLGSIHYAGAVADPLAALLLAGCDTRAKLTMVNGQIRVRDGHLISIDERQLVRHANTTSQRILDESSNRFGVPRHEYENRPAKGLR